jgi:type I restriction enzyme, S subunit
MSRWETMPLGVLAKSVEYGVTASAAQQPVGPKFLRITDIQDGAVDWETVPWCDCDTRSASYARLRVGDIVFARTGATTGKSFLLRKCPDDSVFASYLIRVRLGDKAEPRFISHYFQTPSYWAQITKSARGVAQPGINATTLKALEVPVPPLAEQRRIAEVLDRAEALLAKRRAAFAEVDLITQAIFLDMFGDPLIDHASGVRVPFKSVTKRITYGFTCPMKHLDKGIPIITAKNVREGFIDFDDVHYADKLEFDALTAKSKPVLGDVLITKDGTIGRCAVVERGELFCINQSVALIQPDHSVVLPAYIVAYLSSGRVQNVMKNMGKGNALAHLQITELAELPMPLPDRALQQEFVRGVEAVAKLKAAHRASLVELEALFASLQHRAFRGEL